MEENDDPFLQSRTIGWGQQMQDITYGMDRQQGPTFKELHSVSHDKPNWKIIFKIMWMENIVQERMWAENVAQDHTPL